MSQLRGCATRVSELAKDHVQFISLTGVTAVTLFLAGGYFFGLRRDLVKEREQRHSDKELFQSQLQTERDLRQLDVEKALAQGRAEVTHSMLVYGKSVLELQHAEEYKDAPWRKSASSTAQGS